MLMQTYWLEQAAADLPAHDDWLSADEAVLLNGMRFPKRCADWKLGRWTAKLATAAYLNLSADHQALREIEIRRASSGAPEVFIQRQPGEVTISISHRDGMAACALAMPGTQLGCDLELVEPRGAGFISDYFTAEEQQVISRTSEQDRARLVTLIWSAKESALKALREGLRLDTRDVAVTFDCDIGEEIFAERIGWNTLQASYSQRGVFHGWWQIAGQHVRTIVAAPPPAPPLQLTICPAASRSIDLVSA